MNGNRALPGCCGPVVRVNAECRDVGFDIVEHPDAVQPCKACFCQHDGVHPALHEPCDARFNVATNSQRDDVRPLAEQKGLTASGNGTKGRTSVKSFQNGGERGGRCGGEHLLKHRNIGRFAHQHEIGRATPFKVGQIRDAVVDLHGHVLARMDGNVNFTREQPIINGMNELPDRGGELTAQTAVAS